MYCSTNTTRVPLSKILKEGGTRVMNLTPIDLLSFVIDEISKSKSKYAINPETDFIRDRKLPFKTLLMMLIRMEGNCMNAEIMKQFPDLEKRMCASAVIQQRDKLKSNVFLDILRLFNQYLPIKHRLKGYRILAIDGSKIQVPLNRKGKYFFGPIGRPKKDGTKSEDISMVIMHGIHDILNRRFVDMRITPAKDKGNDERSSAIDMLLDNELSDAIVLMDRGYDGYNMIENANRSGARYVIRSRDTYGAIAEIANLPDEEIDKWFHIRITTSNKKELLKQGYRYFQIRKKDSGKVLAKGTHYRRWDHEETCTVSFRVVKFQLDNGEWEILITNLNRNEFGMKEMKELYHLRWGIETAYRDLKCTLGAKVFHSRKDNFIEQELMAHTVVYNLVSALIEQIIVKVKKGEKHPKKVDFKMAFISLRQFWFSFGNQTYETLLLNIESYVHSDEPGRKDTRKKDPPASRLIPFSYRYAA